METIQYHVNGPVAFITLNRPHVLNSFNHEMHLEFYEALVQASKDTSVRCVVIQGAGKGFSAGADLAALKDRPSDSDVGDYLRETYNQSIHLMANMEKPILAVIHGAAHGAGLGVALAADFRIASHSANFGLAFIKIGLMPDAGVDYFLPRVVGLGRALELATFGDTIQADNALQIGLINKLVADEELEQEVARWAHRLASLPTKAFATMKKTMLVSYESDLATTLEREAVSQSMLAESADHKEGVLAFYEKRRPNFTGK